MSMQANTIHSCFQKDRAQLATASNSYYVELPLEALDDQGSLLDSLIQFAFDTLRIQHLDLRIIVEAQ